MDILSQYKTAFWYWRCCVPCYVAFRQVLRGQKIYFVNQLVKRQQFVGNLSLWIIIFFENFNSFNLENRFLPRDRCKHFRPHLCWRREPWFRIREEGAQSELERLLRQQNFLKFGHFSFSKKTKYIMKWPSLVKFYICVTRKAMTIEIISKIIQGMKKCLWKQKQNCGKMFRFRININLTLQNKTT